MNTVWKKRHFIGELPNPSLKLCIYLKAAYTPLYWYVKSALMNSIHDLPIYWTHKTVFKKKKKKKNTLFIGFHFQLSQNFHP